MIRSAESEDLQDFTTGLSANGKKEVELIQTYFNDKKLDAIYLSAQKNAQATIKDLISNHKNVFVTEEFNERCIGPRVANLDSFSRRQWQEIEYKLANGESFVDVTNRMIDGLEKVVTNHKDEVSLIVTHSMALASVIHFFDETFDYDEYVRTNSIYPWIVQMEFEEKTLVSLLEIKAL